MSLPPQTDFGREARTQQWIQEHMTGLMPHWQFSMRRDMQEILPDLFLGPYAAASRQMLPSLQSRGITHIVCVRQKCEANIIKPNFPDCFRYKVVDLDDSMVSSLLPHVSVVTSFVDAALADGGRVLVHGNVGYSRSAALVIAYVMHDRGWNANQAFRYVQSLRTCIQPNKSFMNQLCELEPILLARRQVQTSDLTGRATLKRPFAEDDDFSAKRSEVDKADIPMDL